LPRTVTSTGWHTHMYVAVAHHVTWFPPVKNYNYRWTKKSMGKVSATFYMSSVIINIVINTVFVAIYQARRRNKVEQGNHHRPTYRKDRSTEACMTVTAVRNQVVVDASLCKTSATLFHCWYLLTSLSKWTASSDSGQFAAPPSSREIRRGCGYSHSDVYLKICRISGKLPTVVTVWGRHRWLLLFRQPTTNMY